MLLLKTIINEQRNNCVNSVCDCWARSWRESFSPWDEQPDFQECDPVIGYFVYEQW